MDKVTKILCCFGLICLIGVVLIGFWVLSSEASPTTQKVETTVSDGVIVPQDWGWATIVELPIAIGKVPGQKDHTILCAQVKCVLPNQKCFLSAIINLVNIKTSPDAFGDILSWKKGDQVRIAVTTGFRPTAMGSEPYSIYWVTNYSPAKK